MQADVKKALAQKKVKLVRCHPFLEKSECKQVIKISVMTNN